MACDFIENYEGHPAFQFFRDFDPDCDWSSALQGEVGEWIVVVRRAKGRYFLGATTDESARSIDQPLDFLAPGTDYTAIIYADAPDSDWVTNPYAYVIDTLQVTSADILPLRLASGGGCAISFFPAK
jgi:alpha-glucosidase